MRSSIIGLMVTLTFALFVAPLAANAQLAGKVHRIGRLSFGSAPSAPDPSCEAFRQGLRDLGYVEGQNLVIEQCYAEGRTERLRDLAAELARLQVEVLVTVGNAATCAAQHASSTIPIVMAASSDPLGQGFVASLAQPGSNITGLSWLGRELNGKRLELLRETAPKITSVAVLGTPESPGYQAALEVLTAGSHALGLRLHVLELRRADELDTAFASMTREGAEALFVLPDPQLIDQLDGRIAELAARHRLPAMYPFRRYVEAGGLMSYGPSFLDLHRRAATYVDKLLKGAKPADLPVEQPMKFELVINLKTAQALGLTMPPTLLFLADEALK